MEKNLLSNAAVKNIAYITMFIDHFFAVVYRVLMQQHQAAGYEMEGMEQLYSIGRAIGRTAFVLFAYLAVEGFMHTRSRKQYLLRLGMFAFVSEIPFDLAFSGVCFHRESQNVFFTLFLGVLALTVWEWTVHRGEETAAVGRPDGKAVQKKGYRKRIWQIVGSMGVLLCCAAAYALQTDYKFMGVLLIFVLYQTRARSLSAQMGAAGCVMLFGTWGVNCLKYAGSYSLNYLFQFSMGEMYGLFAVIPIFLYNGKKGRQLPKAFCYGFYPVHLLLLYGAAWILRSGI